MTPVLSIVIPTKDRYPCLEILVTSLRGFQRRDFEIIVADNTADNETFEAFVRRVADERVRYVHTPTPLSMSENCHKGLAAASGSYVCMLGDDDGIAEWALELVDWMSSGGVDAALTIKPVYRWPGVHTRVHGARAGGSLMFRKPTGKIREITPRDELRRSLTSGATDLASMPRVYHGIVRRTCLTELERRCGTAFPGPSPDMANAVGLSHVVRRMILIDWPVVVTGNSPKSAGGRGSMRDHVGTIRDQPHLAPTTDIEWTPSIPKFWSGPTIWAESAFKALVAINGHAHTDLNHYRLYSSCLVFHWSNRHATRRAIRRFLRDGNRSAAVCYGRVLWGVARIFGERVKQLGSNLAYLLKLPGWFRIAGLPTIDHGLAYLHSAYGPQPKPWERDG